MPIMTPTPSAPPPRDPVVPRIENIQTPSAIVDTRYDPVNSLLQYVDGAPWVVNYYGQVVGQSDDLQPQSTVLNPIYQQYHNVRNLEIKVTQPLAQTQSQNPESKSMEVIGMAVIYSGVIPKKGDMFTADVGDGRMGLFTVTTSERRTLMRASVYQIEYTMVDYLTLARGRDLDRKTIRTDYFVKDYLNFGQSPLVSSIEMVSVPRLNTRFTQLLDQYLREFFSPEHETLLVPGQASATYDPYLVPALMSWLTFEDHLLVDRINLPEIRSDAMELQTSIWDCLSQMDDTFLSRSFAQAGLLSLNWTSSVNALGGIYLSHIRSLVVLQDPKRTSTSRYLNPLLPTGTATVLDRGTRTYTDLERLLPITELRGFYLQPNPVRDLPLIPTLPLSDSYVFPKAFYTHQRVSSKLEQLTLDTLQGKTVSRSSLSDLASEVDQWLSLERFYYVPVLLALIRTRLRSNA